MKSKISPEDAEEYTQSLGQITGGSWRQIALAHRMGVPQALGLSTEEWVRNRLGGYVRLAIEDRQEAVVTLVLEEGLSQRQAAEVLGVGETTVRRDLAAPNGASDNEESSEIAPNDAEATDEAKRIENQRETMVRLAEQAYNSTVAWSVESFQQSVNESLADPKFRTAFLSRVRIDPSNLREIEKGAKNFARLLTKLTK